MKTIERYVAGSFLTALALGWLVLTFVLSIGLLVQVTSLIARGIPVSMVGRFFLTGIPLATSFTIPLAVLTASLLVFGRLSTDSEIAAMRACGINLLRVMQWPLLLSLALSGVCFYLHNEVSPRCDAWRDQIARQGMPSAMGVKLMEPGVFNEGPNHMKIWFASREGPWLNDLRIYDKTKSGLDREIRAERACVSSHGNNLNLDLYNATIDPLNDDHPGAAHATRFAHEIVDAFQPSLRPKKVRTCGSGELRRMLPEARALARDPGLAAAIVQACPECNQRDAKGRSRCRNPVHELARAWQDAVSRAPAAAGPNPAPTALAADARTRVRSMPNEILLELNKRAAFACAPFWFALIGLPLGIRTHRRESSIGVAMGLGIALLFYLAMIAADALKRSPGMHPEWIVWLPAVVCVAVAAVLIPRNQ